MRVSFQDPVTGIMDGIIKLHNDIMFFILIVVTLVSWMLITIVREYSIAHDIQLTGIERMLEARKHTMQTIKMIHGRLIEIIWTITPSFILIAIAVPSFALLYTMDELIEPKLTIKVIGHQWYWSYEYSDYAKDIAFDSYMVAEEDLILGDSRLLEVDRKVWLPTIIHVRAIITSADVLHSWAVPSMGIKMDAVPGRLNQTSVYIKRDGVSYGQCSELCGVNHGFMPITVKAVSVELYNAWLIALTK